MDCLEPLPVVVRGGMFQDPWVVYGSVGVACVNPYLCPANERVDGRGENVEAGGKILLEGFDYDWARLEYFRTALECYTV